MRPTPSGSMPTTPDSSPRTGSTWSVWGSSGTVSSRSQASTTTPTSTGLNGRTASSATRESRCCSTSTRTCTTSATRARGAPDWAIVGQAAGEGPGTQAGFPANYLLSDPLNHAYDAFWDNTTVPGTGRGVQDFYADAWAHVATRFNNKPGIVGYNLFNEPWPGSSFRGCLLAGGATSPDSCGIREFEATKLTAFHERITDAIRRVDERTLVWPAPTVAFDFGWHTGVGKVDQRAGFAFNAYCVQGSLDAFFPFVQGKSCAETAELTLDNALAESERNGDALFMTEFGAVDDVARFADYLRAANERMISWTYWSYWNADVCCGPVPAEGIIHNIGQPPVGANVKTDKLSALTQPYAAVTSGTPEESEFDESTRTYRYLYSTSAVGAGKAFGPGSETELIIPSIQYPTGYTVSVTGARVVSTPGARVLRLKLCSGAQTVEVHVSPGHTATSTQNCS